jgi:site-specific DNA recombinase
MDSCVIYARVSTKEQQDEGYSIPAQLKAMRAFCAEQSLTPLAEFVEAESAGRAGRKQFEAMLRFFMEHPEARTVVAHKLDRLYRNFSDQLALEEGLGVRARYVMGDMPATPQGELLRDVQLSVAKYYLGNLSEEVRKGMAEKVAQGGWPHRAPLGYLNDRESRTIVPDPVRGPLVTWAFERYASGFVSIEQLARELHERGLRLKSGKQLSVSALHHVLSNPIYAGRIREKGAIYPGAHEPLVSPLTFDGVQQVLSGKRNGTKSPRVFALRGVMYCAECGCLITAGLQKGHVYYRCTHGRGKCANVSYTREEVLSAQIEELLASITLSPEEADALIADARLLQERSAGSAGARAAHLERELAAIKARDARLVDAYLDGTVRAESYRTKADSLAEERRGLELQLSELTEGGEAASSLVEDRVRFAQSAQLAYANGDASTKREVVSQLLWNLTLKDGRIASYQYKRPFAVLEKDPSGAFLSTWWAM